MKIFKKTVVGKGVRFSLREGGGEIGRAWLYLIKNDLHQEPYGWVEDVFVKKDFRGQGWGKKLMRQVLARAKREGCYKVVATSRYKRARVHDFYQGLGFKDWGKEWRLDF